MNIPDSYGFTKRDIEQATDILRRYWMPTKGVAQPTMDEIEFAELAEVAERMATAGRLPTVGEVNAKLARDVQAHHLLQYRAAGNGGGLYDCVQGQIYWFPKKLDRERRQRLEREQREALR